MTDKDLEAADLGFRERLNEVLKSLFDNIRNLTLAGTVIIAGRYLSIHGKKQNPPIDDATAILFIGWVLIALCVLQGILEIFAIVPRVRKRRGYSDGARAFVILFIYTPLVASLLLYLLRS